MLKSEVTRVSGPSSSSRRRSPSDSPEYEKTSKRNRRTPTPSSESESGSESDNDNEREQRKPRGDVEEGEVRSKQTTNPPTTTSAVPPRTGGLYMPPAKLRLLQASLTNKSTPEYQRLAWEALKKTINGRVNKVNTSNLPLIIRELFKDNIVRGRGLLARGIIQAQIASPFYTSVYAALISVINTKFPQIGELVVKRLISSFRRTYQRNDKTNCLATTKFIAHLVNQNILHEIVALQMLVLLLENPSDDSVELAIGFLKECGQKLSQVSPRGLDSVFSTLRNLLHESTLDKRTQYMIEVLFAVRKDQFKANPAVQSGLDLVDENDQYTHMLTLDDPCEPEPMLDVFKYDEQYEENEEKYKEIRKTILDEGSDDEDDSSSSSSDSDEEGDGKKDDVDEEEQEATPAEKEKQQTIIDQTETNLVTLRRTIYLTIQSSIGAEECAHKLLKMNLRPGQEMELCQMILDSCAQQRTYERFFGLLAQRFCLLKKEYIECFEKVFQDQYEIVHRLENVKLRNVAKFFAHLLVTDAISWGVLRCIRLTEEDTTSSSRVYIKNLFLELAEFLGLTKLNNRLTDPTLLEYFDGIFPRDNPKNTRFSINFFTSIGLGGLTDELREFLKTMPRPTSPPPPALVIKQEKEEDDEDYKNSERLQASLRELQMEKTKNKDKSKKTKKRTPSSSSSSSSSSSGSSSSSSSSASPPPPPPPPSSSSRTRRDDRDQRNENSKNDRRQQEQRSPKADRGNEKKKDERRRTPDRRQQEQRSPNVDRSNGKKKEERRRDHRSRSPDRRQREKKASPSPVRRSEARKEDRHQRDKRSSPSPDRRNETRKEDRRQREKRSSPSPDRRQRDKRSSPSPDRRQRDKKSSKH